MEKVWGVFLVGLPWMKGTVEEFCSTFLMLERGEVVCGSSFMCDKCLELVQKYVRVTGKHNEGPFYFGLTLKWPVLHHYNP